MPSPSARPVLHVVSNDADEAQGPLDAELIARCSKNDAQAQEALYRRYAPSLLPFLTRILANEADGLDALQDTFVIAFSKLGKLRDPSAFPGWLRRTGVRCALKTLRRRRLLARLGFGAADEAIELVPSRDATPEVRAELHALGSVLVGLPDAERVPWMLRYVDGYELSEVASLCGASLATVKRRIAAAQAVIRGLVRIGEDDR